MTRPLYNYAKNWDVATLEENPQDDIIVQVSSGGTPDTGDSDYWGGTIQWLTPKEVTGDMTYRYVFSTKRTVSQKGIEHSAATLMPVDTVMLTKRAPVGAVVINKTPMATNQGFLNFRCGKKLLPEFLYYWFRANKLYLDTVANGSTYPELYPFDLFEFQINVPPLNEQQKIIEALGTIDDKIELCKQITKTCESIAWSVFKSWFMEFNFPNDKGNPYRANKGLIVNQKKLEYPYNWKVEPIGKFADFSKGMSYTGEEKTTDENDDLFITLNNITEGGGFKTEYSWIKSDRVKEKHQLREADLIIANTEQTKDARLLSCPALVVFPDTYAKETGVFSHHITKVIPYSENKKYFLYMLLKSKQHEIASAYHTGTGVWGFDIDNFKLNYFITSPPEKMLNKFHMFIEPYIKSIILNYKQVLILKKIRDLLTSRLISGTVRIDEKMKFIQELQYE